MGKNHLARSVPPSLTTAAPGRRSLTSVGVVRSVLKVRVTSVVVSSACMAPVLTTSIVWRTPRTQRTCQVCASAHWTGAVTGRSGKGTDWPMWWTRRRELGSAWRGVCTGRKEWLAALNTVSQLGKVIVLSVVGISYVYNCNIYN